MGALALIAGTGVLPQLLLNKRAAKVVRFEGMPQDFEGEVIPARLEQFGALFEALTKEGVSEICFAGAVTRAKFDPSKLDAVSMALVPRLMQAQALGDDALLREVVRVFEEQGFTVRGAHEIRPDLVAPEGALSGDAVPDGDAARARAVLEALGPLDVGQAAIAAKGQMIGIETLQGTDAMLRFVRDTRPGSGGVLVKRAKPGQDLRIDMPAIGPQTITLAAEAGLSGIELQAGHVLLLDPAAVRSTCEAHGVSLWSVP